MSTTSWVPQGRPPRPIIDNALGAGKPRATVTDDDVNGTYPLDIDDCDLYPHRQAWRYETDLVEARQTLHPSRSPSR